MSAIHTIVKQFHNTTLDILITYISNFERTTAFLSGLTQMHSSDLSIIHIFKITPSCP